MLTITVATAGLAAWIWSERQEENEDDNEHTDDEHDKPDYPVRPPPEGQYGPPSGSFESYPQSGRAATSEDEGFMSRMSGAMRRTPSPQQFLDSAGQRLVAGVAAAGAAVGLGSLREEQARSTSREREDGFSDHERWSEEAESKRVEAQSSQSREAVSAHTDAFNASINRSARDRSGKNKVRKTVAVVLSAETALNSLHDDDDEDDDDFEYKTEHAVRYLPLPHHDWHSLTPVSQSILSHLPQHFDPSTTRLFVLIYAPHLTSFPTTTPLIRGPPSTLSSSYSAISTPAQTPGEELSSISPALAPTTPSTNPPNRFFDALWTQALALVDKQSMILPFTSPSGYIHILRHLAPSLVYLSDTPTLSGNSGENVAQLKGWVGQTIVVVGDEGHGGLADTETETEDESTQHRRETKDGWWGNSDMVGLGKGVDIVDATRVGDDWERRLDTR